MLGSNLCCFVVVVVAVAVFLLFFFLPWETSISDPEHQNKNIFLRLVLALTVLLNVFCVPNHLLTLVLEEKSIKLQNSSPYYSNLYMMLPCMVVIC